MRQAMPPDLYWQLVIVLRARNPLQVFHTIIGFPTDTSSVYVPNTATFFDHIIIRGHRYSAARNTASPSNSLVLIRVAGSGSRGDNTVWVGEIVHIASYQTEHIAHRLFAYVRWLRPLPAPLSAATPWAPLYVYTPLITSEFDTSTDACSSATDFQLQFWHANDYLSYPEPGPASSIVDVQDIISHVVRHRTTLSTGTDVWITLPVSYRH